MKLLKTDKQKEFISFTVEIDSELWKKTLTSEKNKLIKNVHIQGFRKGKAPASLAEKQIKGDAFNRALNALIPTTIDEFEKDNSLTDLPELIDQPHISVEELDDNKAIISIIYDVMPNVKLGDYTNLDVNFSLYKEYDKKEVDQEIDRLLKQSKKFVDSNKKTLENDDYAVIDFVGKMDGEEFIGGSAKDYSLKIGSKSFIDNFEEQMHGMNVGDTKTINVKFPKDYHSKFHANKPAEFTVTLKKIQHQEDYKLDDEFVKSLKINNVNTVDELKKFLENNFKQRNLNLFKEQIKKELSKKLVELVEIDFIPQYTYNDEKSRIYRILEDNAKKEKTTIEKQLKENKLPRSAFEKQIEIDALNSLKYVFAIEKISNDNNIRFDDNEWTDYLLKISNLYGISLDEVEKRMKPNEAYIREEMLNEKVLDYIIEQNLSNKKK